MMNNTKNMSPLDQNEDCQYPNTNINTNNSVYEENQENNAKCKIYNLNRFMSLDLPKAGMILDPIITEGSLSMLHAYRGVGKSFFAMSLALAVANGGKFLRWKAPHPAKVLYVDGEMPANCLQERFQKVTGKSMIEENIDYTENLELFAADMQTFSTIDVGNKKMQEEISRIIKEKGIKLLILDNLSTLTTIDELDAASWGIIQSWLISLRKSGVAVLIIHHSGKRGGQRGISKREDILDLVINLKNKAKSEKGDDEDEVMFNGKCQVMFEKNRNLSKKQISNLGIELLDMDNGSVSWVDTYATVIDLKEQGCSCREIEAITGISKSRVSEIYRMAN